MDRSNRALETDNVEEISSAMHFGSDADFGDIFVRKHPLAPGQ